MRTGETIKYIRMSKGIKAVNLYKSILSKQAAIKFENGKSDTTIEKFFMLLDRLNISLEEYDEIYRAKNNNDYYFTGQYIKLFYQKNIDGLRQLKEVATKEYENTLSEKFRHYASLIQLLIDYLNNNKPCETSLQIIKDYLNNCENWGYYEITLFTNAMIHFSGEYIDSVYGRVKKKITVQSKKLVRYRNEKAIILFNILEKKMIDQEIDKIKFYINELLQLKDETLDNMYTQTMIKYFVTLANAIFEKNFHGDIELQINKIIDFFIFIDMTSKSNQCRDFYMKLKNIYVSSSAV